MKDDIDKERAANREKEELRLNRDIAYKRTQEKEMEELRDRLTYVTKECFALKNEVTPEIKSTSQAVRKLQTDTNALTDSSYQIRKKLENLDPILQVMKDGENLRKSFTDYILKEWHDKHSEDYMTVSSLEKIFEDQEKKFTALGIDLTGEKAKI